MKKKIIVFSILVVSLFLLVGCGKKKEEEKFEVTLNGVDVTPGVKFDEKKIDEEYSYSEVPDCAFGGKGIIYTYENVEISTKEDGTIYSVYFLNTNAKTKEGLSVSDDKAKVKELYGDPKKDENNQMIYRRGKVELTINISNSYVGGIEYILVEE